MRHIVGCMSGTSCDGIDAALVAINGHGLEMQATLVSHASHSFAPSLAKNLRNFAAQQPLSAAVICQLNYDLSAAHQDAISACLATATLSMQADLICAHGQTVFHQPPLSWQMLQPAAIAQHFDCTVLSDLRAADLACGGQGAPITPLADFILFRKGGEFRSVCNLGGFCNLTHLTNQVQVEAVNGFDLCACNHILDAIARGCLNCDYDADGAYAARGNLHDAASQSLLELLRAQAAHNTSNNQSSSANHGSANHKSLGTGDELQQWLHTWKNQMNGADLAQSACWALATCIAEQCPDTELLICAGGGALNTCLIGHLQTHLPCVLSDELGVPVQQREAMAMAILGACCQDQLPITLPQVTGVKQAPLAGTWTFTHA